MRTTNEIRKVVVEHQLPADANANENKLNSKVQAYKLMTKKIAVDSFMGRIEGVTHYFLTHGHGDHYQMLNSKFDYGLIMCSQVTASFIRHKLKV